MVRLAACGKGVSSGPGESNEQGEHGYQARRSGFAAGAGGHAQPVVAGRGAQGVWGRPGHAGPPAPQGTPERHPGSLSGPVGHAALAATGRRTEDLSQRPLPAPTLADRAEAAGERPPAALPRPGLHAAHAGAPGSPPRRPGPVRAGPAAGRRELGTRWRVRVGELRERIIGGRSRPGRSALARASPCQGSAGGPSGWTRRCGGGVGRGVARAIPTRSRAWRRT
jgi:hypothetical protein